ncbi:MAG: prephenate dehydrogenase/arogenate dehydrogenase family protein [Gammaproteobacteria bacterium]|nr:prephenate dehydrogenase/arogenate dehydrogenase family protein [Gammaproteobacteria bacterium]
MIDIGIIGLGRFGKLLHTILAADFSVAFYDVDRTLANQHDYLPLAQLVQCKTLFLAMPISHIESTVRELAPQLIAGTTIIDVRSVKCYPVAIMQRELPDTMNIIATHPMFGPDSFNIADKLAMMIHCVRDHNGNYQQWHDYFANKGWRMLKQTPEEHDRAAAKSQGLTHFLGRILGKANISSTAINTLGYQKLLDIMTQTCHDSSQLFTDMMQFNPYIADMLANFSKAYEEINQQCCLLSKHSQTILS